MAIQFKQATRKQIKAKIAIPGPTNGGKTYTALIFAVMLAKDLGGRVAVLDSEGKAALYSDTFAFDVITPDMFTPPYLHSPETYMAIIDMAVAHGYGCLVIDSLSHEWMGRGGILEIVDDAKLKVKNEFSAWNGPSQRHRALIAKIVSAPIHIVCTLRSEMAYVIEPGRDGRGSQPRAVGLAPEQRKGAEYEFDVILTLDSDGNGVITKTRCKALRGVISRAGEINDYWHMPVVETLVTWLNEGAPADREDEIAAPPIPQPEAPVPDVRNTGNGTNATVGRQCRARSQGVQCDTVIEPEREYALPDGTPYLGKSLIARSQEEFGQGKIFCYPHYTAIKKLRAERAQATAEASGSSPDEERGSFEQNAVEEAEASAPPDDDEQELEEEEDPIERTRGAKRQRATAKA